MFFVVHSSTLVVFSHKILFFHTFISNLIFSAVLNVFYVLLYIMLYINLVILNICS